MIFPEDIERIEEVVKELYLTNELNEKDYLMLSEIILSYKYSDVKFG
jgi:hypothetical protein